MKLRREPAQNLGQAIRRGLLKGITTTLIAAGTVYVVAHSVTPAAETVVTPEHRADPAPAPEPLANRLVKQHACWTGMAPEGIALPGHVVVTTRDGRTLYSAVLVAPALEQLFVQNVDNGLDIHGFCP